MNATYEAKNGKTVTINENGEIRVNGFIAMFSAPENNKRDFEDHCNWADGKRKYGNGSAAWSQGMYDG